MKLPEIIAIIVIVLIVGGAVAYIIKAKKSGRKCIGCPDSCNCSKLKDGQSCSSCENQPGCSCDKL